MVVAVSTFGQWLGAQMERRGIRSGRRLAIEAGFEESVVLDWWLGRRVPQSPEVESLAQYFGVSPTEPLALRQRAEQELAARPKR